MVSGLVNVKFKAESFRRGLMVAQKKQIPFATALALTQTAQGARNILQFGLGRFFTLRRATFIRRGIRIDKATKHMLRASVGSVDQFMAFQALSGTKRGQAEHLSALVPTKALRKSKQSLIPRRLFPQRLVPPSQLTGPGAPRKAAQSKRRRRANKPFVTTFSTGDTSRKFIVRRATRRRFPLEVLWILPRKVEIPERWPFDEIVSTYVRANWPRAMTRALDRALATAR